MKLFLKSKESNNEGFPFFPFPFSRTRIRVSKNLTNPVTYTLAKLEKNVKLSLKKGCVI